MGKYKTWSLNTACFLQEPQSRHSHNPSLKTEFLKVQQDPGYFICPLFSFWSPRALEGPHAHSTSSLCHEYLQSSRQILVQDQDFAHQGCGTSYCVRAPWYPCAVTLPLRCSENENCAPHTTHDFASSAPRNLQTASKDHELQLILVHKPSKRHFTFCTQLICTSGNLQYFTAELFSLLC